MLKVVQRCKRDDQSTCRNRQPSSDSRRPFPVRGGEKQDRRYQRDNGELKDVRQRAFVRRRRLGVADKYCQQRCK